MRCRYSLAFSKSSSLRSPRYCPIRASSFRNSYHDAALIEAVVTFREVSFNNKREILVLFLHLKNRRIIVAEVIICPLSQISMRHGCDLDPIRLNNVILRFSCPFHILKSHISRASFPLLSQSQRCIHERGYSLPIRE